jgi:glycogen debranching enzyme
VRPTRRSGCTASELKRRFNVTFWIAEEQCFAMGLDGQKRQIVSINSNPGHCLATTIVDETLVRPTANRLLADDLLVQTSGVLREATLRT